MLHQNEEKKKELGLEMEWTREEEKRGKRGR